MEEKERKVPEEEEKKKKEKQLKEELPTCTTAPSAEHARASEEDEPCDDGRSG